MQSVQAHLQYLLRDFSKRQQSRGACPPRRGFLGKTGDKGVEAPFGGSQWSRKSQATAKVSKTGIGCRALSSVSSPTWDIESVLLSQPRLCRCFTVLGFSKFSITQFCSEGVFGSSFSYSMQAFLFNLPLARSISYMNHNWEG